MTDDLYDYSRDVLCCQPCFAHRRLHVPEVNGQNQHWNDAECSFLSISNASLELTSNVSRTHSTSKAAFLELPAFTGSGTFLPVRILPSINLFRWCSLWWRGYGRAEKLLKWWLEAERWGSRGLNVPCIPSGTSTMHNASSPSLALFFPPICLRQCLTLCTKPTWNYVT